MPRLLVEWLQTSPEQTHRSVEGTLVFADISGFTKLTERLARHGRVGAEEMSDSLDTTFGELLRAADEEGADLLKWGGDAVLLLFDGEWHAERAARAAHGMRARLRDVGRLSTSAGRATLRMSIGMQSGTLHFFLVGDPKLHRELIVCGPRVSEVVGTEGAAGAGEIAVGPATAALLGDRHLGAAVGDVGRLLRRPPDSPSLARIGRQRAPVDLAIGLPVAIREHLLLGVGDPEHRAIGVAFIAFSGTDRLLTEQGPAVTAMALDECLRNVQQAVAEYEVTFSESDINRDGGKIMLLAGAPTSAGHDAERLLRTARLIVDRAGTLPLRIGVNYGHVFSGDFGPSFRRTYSVKGDAINLAARLCAKAQPGQILATETVLAHSGTTFDATVLPAFTLKGKARPVTALDLGPLVASAAGRVAADGGVLVGRQREIDELQKALDLVRRRTGGLVQVLGEPGIGKSRLLAELTTKARDITVLSVQCDEYESSTPYHSVRTLLRDLLGIRPGAQHELVLDRLSARVRDNAPSLLPWLPLLGTPLDLAIEETEETRGLGEEFRKRRLEEVVVDFLHFVLPTPTLLLCDDAQHMDSSSADLLNRLVARLAAEPWLVVVGRRDHPVGWVPADGEPISTLRLSPLTDEESIQLIQEATGSQPLPRPTIAALAARAAGNPLFLGSLAVATGPTGDVENLPESVQDLVTAQVDRLAPHDRVLLRYASVFGMRFDTGALADLVVGHAPPPGPGDYQRLAEFVEPSDGGTMAFRHSLMREVAYEGLPYRIRQQLHDQVGLSLERADPESRSTELLSLHFFHAKRFTKAWDYSVRAGHLARGKFANREAVDFFTRAVESERRGPRGLVSAMELGQLFEVIGDTWFTIGLPDQAATAYRNARRQMAADPVETARLVAKEARIDQRLRNLPQSLRRVRRALNSLDGLPGRDASSARALLAMRYAISRFAQGRTKDALEWGNRAAHDAEEAVDQVTLAKVYQTLYAIYVSIGRRPDLPYGELALKAYTELDDLPGQASCMNNLAIEAQDGNEWVQAAEIYARSAEIYRRIGDTAGEANAIFNQAEVLVRQGHLDEGIRLLREVLTTARAVSDQELVALVLRELGRATCRLGDAVSGLAWIEEARALFLSIDDPDEVPLTDVAACEALLLAGDSGACLDRTTELLSSGPVLDDPGLFPSLLWIRGFAMLELGLFEVAAAELDAGRQAATEQDDRYAWALCSLGLARAGQPGPGELAAEARAALEQLGVVSLPLPAGSQLLV